MNTHINCKIDDRLYNTRYKFEGKLKEITIKNSQVYFIVTLTTGQTTGDWLENWQLLDTTKCITKECENHKHQGAFVNDLCASCWECITSGAYDKLPKKVPHTFVQSDLTAEGTKVFIDGKEVESKFLSFSKVRPFGSDSVELMFMLKYY